MNLAQFLIVVAGISTIMALLDLPGELDVWRKERGVLYCVRQSLNCGLTTGLVLLAMSGVGVITMRLWAYFA